MHLKSTVKRAVARAFVNRRHTPAVAVLSLTGSAFIVVGWNWARYYLRPEQVFGPNYVELERWRLRWVGSYVILGIGHLELCMDLTSYFLMRRFR